MIQSELGEIPEGWSVKVADDLFEINIGKTPPRNEKEWFSLDPKDTKWLSIKDLGNSGAFILSTSEYLTSDAIKKFNIKIVPKGSVVLSFKLTVGRVGIVNEEMVTNEAIAHFNMKHENEITKEYIYLYLMNFNYTSLGSTSSIAIAVNSKIIKSMPILLPSKVALSGFSKNVKLLYDKILNNQLENQSLTKTRDALLPKLMSGEIRVNL
ncbi:MAG TPA: restriction endonuclease subunit S [Clostridiales bacterium]|nr:restriction endonuclease subunit S [Clostridiales bacterium]HQP70275.1 restriction endonuclease subunit S [Clostridiales bacterium]